jgi:hypothetical protein
MTISINLMSDWPLVSRINSSLTILGWILLFLFQCLFPNGRFSSTRLRWLATLVSVGMALVSLIGFTIPGTYTNTVLFLMLTMPPVVLGTGILVYRYRYSLTDSERQQTKWVVFSFSVAAIGVTLSFLLFSNSLLVNTVILLPLDVLLLFLIPLSILIAILRHRLYAIDLIIRRTIIYGGLVGGLAIAYFGGIALLQFLSQAITGPQSNLVVVLITLGIVALFNPVRRRFQTLIDCAFYREKVDFREAFTAFAREVRTIIDLQELLRTLVTRTTDLFHVTHGAVFLTSADPSGLSNPKGLRGR